MVIIGLLYLVLTFLFSFILVVLFKLAILGLHTLSDEKKPEPPAPKPPKPVYYIVEKKRQRKSKLSEPKEIVFKE